MVQLWSLQAMKIPRDISQPSPCITWQGTSISLKGACNTSVPQLLQLLPRDGFLDQRTLKDNGGFHSQVLRDCRNKKAVPTWHRWTPPLPQLYSHTAWPRRGSNSAHLPVSPWKGVHYYFLSCCLRLCLLISLHWAECNLSLWGHSGSQRILR